MTINGLGPVDPVGKVRKTEHAKKTQGQKADSVEVSSEALSKAELYKAREIVQSAPDIRADRVAEVKQKLEDPNYINQTVLGSVADRLVDLLS